MPESALEKGRERPVKGQRVLCSPLPSPADLTAKMPLSCGPLSTLPTAISCPDISIGPSMSSCPAARVSFGRCVCIASFSLFKAFQVLDSLPTVSNHHDLPHPFLALAALAMVTFL